MAALLPKWYYQHVLGFEGLYADHPKDRGGKTMRGILWTTYVANSAKVYGRPPTWEHFINLSAKEATLMLDFFCRDAQAHKIRNMAIRAGITEIHWGTGNSAPTVIKTATRYGYKGSTRAGAVKFIDELGDSEKAYKLSFTLIENYRLRLAEFIKQDPEQIVFKTGWWKRLDRFQALQKLNYWSKTNASNGISFGLLVAAGIAVSLLKNKMKKAG